MTAESKPSFAASSLRKHLALTLNIAFCVRGLRSWKLPGDSLLKVNSYVLLYYSRTASTLRSHLIFANRSTAL